MTFFFQTDEINARLDAVSIRQNRIQALLEKSRKVAASIKTSVNAAREELSSIKEVGVSFKQGSYLQLNNPPKLLEQLGSRTYVSMYFNISK